MKKFSTYCKKLKVIIKAICFLVIGIGLFCVCEKVFIYKYYWPVDTAYFTKSIMNLYHEDENIDVLAAGTSHMVDGFVPLDLYERDGIISYNIASYSQPIEMSYYLLKEAAKRNQIKVFVYDVGSLVSKQMWWGPVMDSVPLSFDKIEMALNISSKNDDVTFWEVIFPILREHVRWKELSRTDFEIYHQSPLYSKGYSLYTDADWAKYTAEEMNRIDAFLRESELCGYEFSDGEYIATEENITDQIVVSEENMEWLLKMRDLCNEEGIEFLCAKVPCVYHPELYGSAWTLEKSDCVKDICKKNNIMFCDMLYDVDLKINESTADYVDGGLHLNYSGAQKVTEYLGQYLTDHYSLPKRNNAEWDYDLKIYQKVRQLALLQLDFDFASYINRVANEFQDTVILIAASDDMAAGLSEDDIKLLQVMGLQTDFRDKINDSYVALIDHGAVKYEKLSNRKIEYTGTVNGIPFYIESSGYYTGAKASIIISGIEYAVNGRGMNIVVYDDDRNLFYDSVQFDTSFETHYAERLKWAGTRSVRELEDYLTKDQ